MNEIINIGFALLGASIGAIFHYLFTKRNEDKKRQNLLKTSAYSDFFKGIAGINLGNERKDEYNILLADAKGRICIYGSDSVIKRIAILWRKGPNLDNPISIKAFLEIATEMRKDNDLGTNVEFNDISQLLVGHDIE